MDPAWVLSDDTVSRFFDSLERIVREADPTELEHFTDFRHHCEERERAGRTHFGFKYLTRDNSADALEEFSDAANYALFDTLVGVREDAPEDLGPALEVAYHAFKGHLKARALRREHRP
jgi:hypothetical protein